MLSSLKYRDAKREEGFTLIELLVVVIIIGILAAIAIPVFLRQREAGWRASVESDLRNAAMAIESNYTQFRTYPTTLTGLDAGQAEAAPTATETFYRASTDVTVVFNPAPEAGATGFVLNGTHTSLTSGPGSAASPMVYDSEAGGMQTFTGGGTGS